MISAIVIVALIVALARVNRRAIDAWAANYQGDI